MKITDYFVKYPALEIEYINDRIPLPADLEGTSFFAVRRTCVINLGLHLSGIFIKPLVYTAKVVCECVQALFYLILCNQVKSSRIFRQMLRHSVCIILSPVKQAVRATKAFLGIFYPMAYYKFEPTVLEKQLEKYLREITAIADEILEELEKEIEQGQKDIYSTSEIGNHITIIQSFQESLGEVSINEINRWCTLCEKSKSPDLYYKVIGEALKTICERFQQPDFPKQKIIFLFQHISDSLDQCMSGKAVFLQDVASSLDIPENMSDYLSWIVVEYKKEVLKLVSGEVHTTNSIIIAIGKEIGLSPLLIEAARSDPYAYGFSNSSFISKYHNACSKEKCFEYLDSYINADLQDREKYRNYILHQLAEKVREEDLKSTPVDVLRLHEKLLKKEFEIESARMKAKFMGQKDAYERQMKRLMQNIENKRVKQVDASLYAQYIYRAHPEDFEDNKLTKEALELFAKAELDKFQPKSVDVIHGLTNPEL